MAQKELICNFIELEDGGRVIKVVGDTSVAVFKVSGKMYAYENKCAHQGGPACQGRMVPKAVENLTKDKQSKGRIFDHNEMHVVCPWHGAEYVITTGKHVSIDDMRLKSLPVTEEDGKIFVEI